MMARAMIAAGLWATMVAATPPPARPDGTRSCILRSRIQNSEVRDDSTIDFHMRDGTTLRNRLPNPCPELGFNRAFGYSTSIDRLCSVDIITVFRQSLPGSGASCGLGEFTPLTTPDAPRR